MLHFGESFADAVWTSPIWVAALVVFQAGIVLRVIMRRLPVGETLAWTFIVAAVPMVGPLTYLLIGELRIGARRARRVRELYGPIRAWLADLKHARGELADEIGVSKVTGKASRTCSGSSLPAVAACKFRWGRWLISAWWTVPTRSNGMMRSDGSPWPSMCAAAMWKASWKK